MTENLLCLLSNFLCLYLSQTSSHLSVCSLSGSAEVQVVHTFNEWSYICNLYFVSNSNQMACHICHFSFGVSRDNFFDAN